MLATLGRLLENLLAQTLWQVAYSALAGGGVGVTAILTDYPPAVVVAAVVLFGLGTFLLLHSVSAPKEQARPAATEMKGQTSGANSPVTQTAGDSVGRDQYKAGGDQHIHIHGTTVAEAPRVERRTGTGRRAEDRRPQAMGVVLYPSLGDADEVRIAVRNDGATDNFSADCRVFDRRNTESKKRGTYHLRWVEGGMTHRLELGRVGNLLVATFDTSAWRGDRIARIALPEWGSDPYHRQIEWDDAPWTIGAKDPLPVFGLAITISTSAPGPQTYFYRLEPESDEGPLRLVELEREALD